MRVLHKAIVLEKNGRVFVFYDDKVAEVFNPKSQNLESAMYDINHELDMEELNEYF